MNKPVPKVSKKLCRTRTPSLWQILILHGTR